MVREALACVVKDERCCVLDEEVCVQPGLMTA